MGQDQENEPEAPAAGAPDRVAWGLRLLLLLAGGLAYAGSFSGSMQFDDRVTIVENPTIQSLRWPDVVTPPPQSSTVGRPLVNLTLALNYAAGGLDPWGYHAVNLAIHLAAALVLFELLRLGFSSPALREWSGSAAVWLAGAGSLLWVVHPLNTQAISYITQRCESLMGLFLLLMVYAGVRALRSAGWFWPTLAAAAGVLGVWCKEVIVVAPFLILLYDLLLEGRPARTALRDSRGLYVSLAVVWTVSLAWILTGKMWAANQKTISEQQVTLAGYALAQPEVIWHYLKLTVWPANLCLDYQWPAGTWAREWLWVALAAVGLLAIGAGVWRRQSWSYAAAWFGLILAPTSSLMPLGDLAFEHRMYLPLAGLCAGAAALGLHVARRLCGRHGDGDAPVEKRPTPWRRLTSVLRRKMGRQAVSPEELAVRELAAERRARRIAWGVLLLVALALGWRTARRQVDYQDEAVMWRDVLRQRPDNVRALNNLGDILLRTKHLGEAAASFGRAIELDPERGNLHYNLGRVLVELGYLNKAEAEYRLALGNRLDDRLRVPALNNLGALLNDLGRSAEALPYLAECLQLNPRHSGAYDNYGNALVKLGRSAEALPCFENALRLNPRSANTFSNLAGAYLELGKLPEAEKALRQALEINPQQVQAWALLGLVKLQAKDYAAGGAAFTQAVQLQPDNYKLRANLGAALMLQGKVVEAREQYRRALQHDPGFAAVRKTLLRLGEKPENLPPEPGQAPNPASATVGGD